MKVYWMTPKEFPIWHPAFYVRVKQKYVGVVCWPFGTLTIDWHPWWKNRSDWVNFTREAQR